MAESFDVEAAAAELYRKFPPPPYSAEQIRIIRTLLVASFTARTEREARGAA